MPDDTEQKMSSIRDSAAEQVRQAREDADREDAARQVADAEARADQAERDAGRARQTEAAAVTRAERAQAVAADETARIRSDHRHALNQLTAATAPWTTSRAKKTSGTRATSPQA
jgi:hypothetical protein